MLWLAVKALIRAYQVALSPILHAIAGPGAGCRFEPSCSKYMEQAVHEHGIRGVGLGLRRLSRCHPFSRSAGHDPVPATMEGN